MSKRDLFLDLTTSALDYLRGRTTRLPEWAENRYDADQLMRTMDPTGGFLGRVQANASASGLDPNNALMQGVSQTVGEAIMTGRYIPGRGTAIGGWEADLIGTVGTFVVLGLFMYYMMKD